MATWVSIERKARAVESRALQMFGARVRELRKERALSQEALAEAANLNRSYLSEIEQGLVNPTILVVFRLARAFGMPVAEMFDDYTVAVLGRLKL
jgi:transcriptional regulator with XRE-family HTH domain